MTVGRVVDIPAYTDPIGKHTRLVAKPENFTPPTHNPDDCICGGGLPGSLGRTLIANCPCCDGVQILVEELCDCDGSLHKIRVILPPDDGFRIRYIDKVEPIE